MALKARKSNVVPIKKRTSPSLMAQMAQEYDEVSSKIKLLDNTKKELSDKIKLGAEELGVKNDKGSFYYDCGDFICGKEAKKSVSLHTDRTVAYLNSKGLAKGIVKKQTSYVVDESALEELVRSGKISQKDFEELCDIKVSYSVSVKRKEEMPEVEQGTLKAASRK